MSDPVNNPTHYKGHNGVDCITAMEAMVGPAGFAAHLRCQVLKYLWRYEDKGNPVQDLNKARFYLDRLIELSEDDGEHVSISDELRQAYAMAALHSTDC